MRPRSSFGLVTLALLAITSLACGGGGGGGSGQARPPASAGGAGGGGAGALPAVVLQIGPDLAPAVADRVRLLLGRGARRPLEERPPTDRAVGLAPGSLVVSLGSTAPAIDLAPDADLAPLGSEGFVVRSTVRADGVTVVAARGNPPIPDRHGLGVNAGLAFGAYAALEALGFAFLHPLAPTIPDGLALSAPVDRAEAPHWPFRGWHLHTTHPLELTNLSQGWGATPADEAGWRSQLPEWELFCEWLVANRQNHLQWVLLHGDSWAAFSESPARQARLAELVAIGHRFGLGMGLEVPLAQVQQHNFHMIRQQGTLADEVAQIEARIDWVMAAGFDLLATIIGTTEFSHADDRRVLAWIDAATAHLADGHGAQLHVKAHTSAGLKAEHFPDPRNPSEPINFNFLGHYADPRAAIRPHTVQHYALDDPAPTYGHDDFAFMRDFIALEAGRRDVIWHPETAYWVSFDVDVPLFLPIYADRRLHDLRLIAADERAGRLGVGAHAGSRIQGQSNFSSGWEWGYWLNDVVTARAAWDPQPAEPDDAAARRAALAPVVAPFGAAADDVADVIAATIADQQALLIEGEVAGRPPRRIARRNGQAYLQGWETWDELALASTYLPLPFGTLLTQPKKLTFFEQRLGLLAPARYDTEVKPLLAAMETAFTARADAFEALRGRIPARGRPLFDDLADAARMTALRARQVHGLHDWVELRGGDPIARRARLDAARSALDAAAAVVARREAGYRVPADRIAGWGENPTAYEFGYLWTVRSLHYWWRDEGLAVDEPLSPSYLNIIDPLDVAIGEGVWTPIIRALRAVLGANAIAGPIADFLAAPAVEPVYPPNGLRQRP